MSFKSVASSMAKSQGVSQERANAMLAVGTRKAMAKRGMSVKHGIPKNVWNGPKPRGHSPLSGRSIDPDSPNSGLVINDRG